MNTANRHTRALSASLGACVFALLTGVAVPAFALEPAVESQLIANRVVTEAGAEVLKPADKASPGDVIEYRARYVNKGTTGVAALAATIPVPPGTEFWNGSTRPSGALASVDGINFAAIPLKRTVRAADGKTREETIPTTEYRAVRWDLGALPPGTDATVSLRVRVTPIPAPASQSAATK